MKLHLNRAIVTGAARGLGMAVAEIMWREGASLLLVDRCEAALGALRVRLQASAGPQQEAHAFGADLADPAAPQAIMADARRIWPRIDVLVNNAAITGPIGMVADNDWADWRETIQVDLLAPAELCKLAIGWMRETGGGSIVNLSGGGATGPRPNFSAYATAKCALVRFSETVAAEVAGLGIRVNCIAPGAMNSAMLQEILQSGPELTGVAEYEQVRKTAAAGGTDPKIAAELIVYLASKESAGITGKLISALWDPWRDLHRHTEDLIRSDVYTLRRIVPEERGQEWARA